MDGHSGRTAGFVVSKIERISSTEHEGTIRATLAHLRRGIGKKPASTPSIWEYTLEGMPEDLVGRSDEPSPSEWAAHCALTLFALHQQGFDPKTELMHVKDNSLGRAVGLMAANPDDEKRIKRRFDQVITASDISELSHHLRGIIQLLKQNKIGLDYYSLASDFFDYQYPESRDRFRLKWGRDYYSTIGKAKADQKYKNDESKGEE